MSLQLIFRYFIIALALSPNVAASHNITIDDEQGDETSGTLPAYSPTDQWSQGATCSSCLAKPDVQQAFDGTWHDALHIAGDPTPRVVSLQFNGSAIYAFFIVAGTIPNASTLTDLNFQLDGSQVGTFLHNPTGPNDYQYNVTGYANTSIPNGPHQLDIIASGESTSIVLFDYAVYTVDDPPSPSNPPTPSTPSNPPNPSSLSSPPAPVQQGNSRNVPAIVGSIVGVLLLLVIGVVTYLWLRRRRRPKEVMTAGLEPYMGETGQIHRPYSFAAVRTVPEDTTTETDYSRPQNSSIVHTASFVNAGNLSSTNYTNIMTKNRSADASARGSTIATLPSALNHPTSRSGDESRRLLLELQQRMRDMQDSLASLTTSSNPLTSAPNGSHYVPELQGSSDIASQERRTLHESEAESLRRSIAALQTEVDRLRSQQAAERGYGFDRDPPPGYNTSDSWPS